MVQQSARLLTAEDLFRLPEDETHTELIRGELKQRAPAGGEHGSLAGELHFRVSLFTHNERLGGRTFIADTGFILQRDPDTVRAPDFAFIRQERLPDGLPPIAYIPIAPDLAVEIISPSESAEDVHDKVREYLDAGTALIWLVYPRRKSVVVQTHQGARTLNGDDVLDGGDVLPGFHLPICEIFSA
jgi:Uma2 family endonuclease